MSLETMRTRLEYLGGIDQHDRNVHGRKYTLEKAIKSGYFHNEKILLADEDKNFTIEKMCIIVPISLNTDDDTKEITMPEEVLEEGMCFKWERTDSVWMVLKRKIEAEGIFTAIIRRCKVCIDGYWCCLLNNDPSSDISVKGGIVFGDMNGKLNIMIQKTEETMEKFSRNNIITIEGHRWRVGGTAKLNQQNIIQVELEEYFDKNYESEVEDENDIIEDEINGPNKVQPYDEDVVYSVSNYSNGVFKIDNKNAEITSQNGNRCIIDVLSTKKGSFKLTFEVNGAVVLEKNIEIASL